MSLRLVTPTFPSPNCKLKYQDDCSCYPAGYLEVGGVLIVRRHDAVVKVRGGGPRQHQVGEAGRDLVLRVDQRHVRLVLHLSLQSDRERGGVRGGE